MKNKRKVQSERGITIISLVVTVFVMVILGFTAIYQITRDDAIDEIKEDVMFQQDEAINQSIKANEIATNQFSDWGI